MKHKLTTVLVVVAFAAVALGCSKQQGASQGDAAKYAAKVGSWTMSREDLETLVESLPEHQKGKYNSYEGKVELTERFIQEELYYREALRKKLNDEEEIRDQIDKYKRSLLAAAFFDREIKPRAFPDEEEIVDFYETNKEKYTIQPLARAQHILSSDSLKLVKFKERVEKGEPFTTLAHQYSEDDLTRPDGGALGYFNPGGYIRNIGYSRKLGDAAFTLKPGDMTIVKWDRGYSLIVLNELRPAEVRPLDEVREEIRDLLTQRELEKVDKAAFAELRKQYEVHNFVAEEMTGVERTPEELWNLAQNTTDSHQRLAFYDQIVKKYPNSEYAPEALFMIGFVHAEELHSAPDADRAFSRVIREYPNSEVAKTAEWMLKNLGEPLPDFEDLDDLNRQIKDKSE
jgi:hypothetical protein